MQLYEIEKEILESDLKEEELQKIPLDMCKIMADILAERTIYAGGIDMSDE